MLSATSLRARHYPVGRDVADAFAKRFGSSVLIHFGDQTHLNLALAIQSDLASIGVPAGNITLPMACTYCEPVLSSWRRDGKAALPMLALIVLKS
ncbi:MAG: laccase domain-containing protein [bacterium]